MADAGDEFSGTMTSIGKDLFALFKTIIQERQRREREAQAQMAAAAKEGRAEEKAAQLRQEEREFIKAENEKMRAEMRDILKANGMEVSDQNLAKTQELADKMEENQSKIDGNQSEIESNLSEIDGNQSKIVANNKAMDRLDDQIKAPGARPEDVTQFEKMKAGLKEMNSGLDKRNDELAKRNTALEKMNSGLEVDNAMLKSGKGLDQLQQDPSVRNNLAKQMDQVNAGISLDQKNIERCNDRIPKIEKEQAELLNSPKPDMDKWEKLQAEKQGLQKDRTLSQEGLAKKEEQLKALKEGKSLEQLEKAGKLEASIAQGKQEIAGQDKIIKGYEVNQDALTKKQDALIAERNKLVEKPGVQFDSPEVLKFRKEIQDLEQQKKGIQDKIDVLKTERQEMEVGVDKLGTELDDVNKEMGLEKEWEKVGNMKVGPEESVEAPKQVQKIDSPKEGLQVGGPKGPKPGSKDDGEVGLKSKKTVLQSMDERGETPEFVKRKRGMSMGEGLGQKQKQTVSVRH